MRRGDATVTLISTACAPPDISTRNAGNVPAGTVIVSCAATLSVSTRVAPSPAENV
jgi:hypothetical protein